MDLRGHGELPIDFDPATESTLDGYVDDPVALLDIVDLRHVHCCGESFGDTLGMVLAAEHPARVRTLTLEPEACAGRLLKFVSEHDRAGAEKR